MKFKVKIISLLVIVLISFFFILLLIKNKNESPKAQLSLIEKLESNGPIYLKAKDISGAEVDWEKFSGKIKIFNFWASWCGPCLEEIPSLVKLMNNLSDKAVLIAISGDDSLEEIKIFLKSFPETTQKNIYIIYDEDKKFMKAYEVEKLPETFIFSPKNKLAKKITGSINWFNEDSMLYMNELFFKN